MQNLPSEDHSRQVSSQQNMEISDSRLNNSPIVQGRDINQIIGDINYFIYSMQDDFSQEKINQIRKYEDTLRMELKVKIDKAALLIHDLRSCIEDQLTSGNPKKDATLLKLLDELQCIVGKQSQLQFIQEDLDFCYEGGTWLYYNKHRLAQLAAEYTFKQEGIINLLRETKSKLSFQELETRFLQDIETYITWISIHMKAGTTPSHKNLRNSLFRFHLDLPESIYKHAFVTLNLNFVDPSVSNLSTGAANNTASYFNRFVVDRDLRKDPKVSVDKNMFESISFPKFIPSSFLLVFLALAVVFMLFLLK